MSIEVRDLNKRFGNLAVCDGLNLHIGSGELVALLGPSGSGKTTLLRIIAGLERPDSGSVSFHGEDATHVDVRDRNVGFVFQHYALFRHMTVFENVAFGLRVQPRRIGRHLERQRLRELPCPPKDRLDDALLERQGDHPIAEALRAFRRDDEPENR